MLSSTDSEEFDVAIVGGGPAGLSAAIVLGRACRRVVLFDHGRPRNYAAQAVHGFLGVNGIAPEELRKRGRNEAASYGVGIKDRQVTSIKRLESSNQRAGSFELITDHDSIIARTLLLATGMIDSLPEIPGIKELYGRSVHHCPYCDGWEHRQQQLVALGDGPAAVKLAMALRTWSKRVTVCTNGTELSPADCERLKRFAIPLRLERIRRLNDSASSPVEITFERGQQLACDAVFFSADQSQRSALPQMLGCEIDDEGLVRTYKKQHTCIEGVFIAGDAEGDVQFAVAAAAEGAIAAVAINQLLQDQDVAVNA